MTQATCAGWTPRTTGEEELPAERPDDGDCVVCGADADGIDARTRQPMCRKCATIRCDGGRDVSAGRRRVTSSINFGCASNNYVATPGDDVNHLSGEVSIEVSGASTDYPHPTRLQREIEAAVSDVLDDYAERVSDDVDRGDGIWTDGGEDQFSVRVGEIVREIEEEVDDSTDAEAMLYARCSAAFEDAVNNTDLPAKNALGVMTAALFEATDQSGYDRVDVIETAREHYIKEELRTDGGEPVASTGGGRHAPAMGGSTTPERTYAHYCDEVGSTVYSPRRRCPHGCYQEDER